MAGQAIFDGDVVIAGRLAVGQITLPSNAVSNSVADPSNPLAQDKYKPRFSMQHTQARGPVVASGTFPVYLARATGTVMLTFKAAMAIANAGAATVVVSVLKNGVSITGTAITLNNTHVAFQNVTGTLSGGTVALGDVFEVVVVATAGGGTIGQGLIVSLDFSIDPYTA